MAGRRTIAKHDFSSEADLCAFFAEKAKDRGWKVYPETSGYDMLLVATAECTTRDAVAGDQVGVHAKLRASIEVLDQALCNPWDTSGPNYVMILVPKATREFRRIAVALNIMVTEASSARWSYVSGYRRERTLGYDFVHLPTHYRLFFDEPLWVPEVEIWTTPGVKSPRSVTPWKIRSVRLCIEGLNRGYLLTADFKRWGISMTRWVNNNWVVPTGEKIGRSTIYKLNEVAKPPHIMWPEITEKLLAHDAKT